MPFDTSNLIYDNTQFLYHRKRSDSGSPPSPTEASEDTIVLFIDGSCIKDRTDGQDEDKRSAGCGIYFGPDSPYNMQVPLGSFSKSDTSSFMVELSAANKAMDALDLALEATSYEVSRGGLRADGLHVEVVSDCQSLVDGLERYIEKRERGIDNASRRDFFDSLYTRIQSFKEELGVMVKFLWVPRTENTEADKLAYRGAQNK